MYKVNTNIIEEYRIRGLQEKIDRWGVWLALIAWVPFIGDVFVIALGFYRTRQIPTILLLLIGKALRFLAWTMLFIR